MNIARLMEAARDIALKSQQKVDEVVWGGITTHSFPPVEVARRIVVLRQWKRLGEQGRILWYDVVQEGKRAVLAIALQMVD